MKGSVLLRYLSRALSTGVMVLLVLTASPGLNLASAQTLTGLVEEAPATARGPGTDLPVIGFSLFDQIFSRPDANGAVYEVPYPFEKILQRIVSFQSLSTEPDESGYVNVLIPKGRSLQREAARPDFFRYPRILLALNENSTRRTLSKDRLFLGYQEKGKIIEVISYNEAAGRFEFQIVTNYAPDMQPIVNYAPRFLCLSCHQNAAPIFPRATWQETNFNNFVAERIRQHHTVYHGIAIDSLSGRAGLFDLATDRANLFSVYQKTWRKGCGPNTNNGRSCRASLFLAMLHYRLGSIPKPLYRSQMIEDHLLPNLSANWDELWPQGLPVPVADLKDRAPQLDSLEINLAPDLDPLSPRPPLSRWSVSRAADLSILGLSDSFLLDADIKALNDYLHNHAANPGLPGQHFNGDCDIEIFGELDEENTVSLECSLESKPSDSRLSLFGELLLEPNGKLNRNLSWLYISDGKRLVEASVSGTIVPADTLTTRIQLQLFKFVHSNYSRLWDNRSVSTIELSFDRQPQLASKIGESSEKFKGHAGFRATDDFVLVEDAVSELLQESYSGKFNGFDSQPFQGIRVTAALFKKLGIPVPEKTGLESPVGLKLTSDSELFNSSLSRIQARNTTKTPVDIFMRYCGACHSGNTLLPPGFLAGSRPQIETQLENCAERIDYRLGMWKLNQEHRLKSPMPPMSFLEAASIDSERWRSSFELNSLRNYVQSRINRDSINTADSLSLHERYENLPACLRAQQ
jgi:hypothetical protein